MTTSAPAPLSAVPENTTMAASAKTAGAGSAPTKANGHSAPTRSESASSFMSQAASIGLCLELVPEYISFRVRSLSCNGLHDKTQVRFKLQNISQSTKPGKNLGDHTHSVFDFTTTVHNMTFDIVKIDLFDFKSFGQNAKIGRSYLPLRDLQKKVGNKYDNDGDDNTEPEQSVLSTRFDAAAFCKKHDDTFEIDLPLYKHGSYSKFGSSQPGEIEEVTVTKGSDQGRDQTIQQRRRLVRADSFAQVAMNGLEVGMVTVEATLHFKDQTQNPLFAHLGTGLSRNGTTSANGVQRRASRSHSNASIGSTVSTDSSTLGDMNGTPIVNSPERSSSIQSFSSPRGMSVSSESHPGRILQMPSSPPNLSLHYGNGISGPLSPPLSPTMPHSPGSPTSPGAAMQWLSDNNSLPQGVISSWEESDLHCNGFVDGDEGDFEDDNASNSQNDHVKGEHLTQADRDREEELMANIMANGDQVKKDQYLNKSQEEKNQKGKKKFNFFSEQTRSAFQDIKLMYSSFFGHGWNLSRAEFWRGFNIVEQFYARNPTPTTNHAFDNIEILEHARHFVRLAIASYGSLPWVYFGYSFKVAPLNFIRFNSDRKNVMDYFKLKKEDMIVWHFDKRTALVPSYYIVRDPKYNALCIIIRGTFSITDAMTDLVCEYYPYKGGLVHKGIMDNARFVLERSGKDIEAALKKFNLKTIYCIGHSLGAGSASLLCSLLQDHFEDFMVPGATPTEPAQKLEVKAYLFAPPPICTPNLAAQWERTQIAFINENDIVCRLSYGNALDLKELIKIGALESLNPIYDGMKPKEKLDKILKVLAKAQESLRAVNDIPRLVTGGTVTYIHKVYEDTPVVKNNKNGRDSKFGLPDTWSENSNGSQRHGSKASNGRARGMSTSSTASQNPLTRSLTAITSALTIKNHGEKSSPHRHNTAPILARETPSGKTPKVTPYNPNQPAVRLSSTTSLVLNDCKELKTSQNDFVDSPLASPTAETNLGEPIIYDAPSNARDLTTQQILDHGRDSSDNGSTRKSQSTSSLSEDGQTLEHAADEEEEEDDDDTEDEMDKKVYTTTKPRKHGSKKKEIRIEFSDKEHFMAIPLRTNWLWHHFPQQYDSRIERSLAWAKAHKAEQEKKLKLKEQRKQEKMQRQQSMPTM
ncbi:hypothetical protein EMPS_07206 [Entomortierella parvispora]|uniref:sn-1-specific diacylglycerol lipase n=1 Tax=Entomortierella parvispora TaxID=205924 RepID=A0A9P3HE51_9FUNG|nr:hypothetical protein EMPS_07206 [Entomortierella parvispora]